jgi:hypothetical protein
MNVAGATAILRASLSGRGRGSVGSFTVARASAREKDQVAFTHTARSGSSFQRPISNVYGRY